MTNENAWPIGVTIYLLGTLMGGLGANLQRKSFIKKKDGGNTVAHDDDSIKNHSNFFLWGLTLFICSGIFMSLALIFTSQTSLAPLLLFLLVFNAGFANIINKERIDWVGLDGLAMVIVVIGISMAIVGAPKESETYNLDQVKTLMSSTGFISFFVTVPTVIVIIWTGKRVIEKRDLASSGYSAKIYLYVSYGALAGTFGGLNITSTKLLFATLIGGSEDTGFVSVITSPIVWLIAIFLITTYLLQLMVAIEGLEAASSIIVMSAHSVLEEIVASLGGIFCFDDAEYFEQWEWLMFFFGNILAIIGVFLLTHSRLKHITEDNQYQSERDSTGIEIGGQKKIIHEGNGITDGGPISYPAHYVEMI